MLPSDVADDTAAGLSLSREAADREVVPRAASNTPLPQRRWLPYGTAALGFILGVLFWHFVGFWSFVAEVAFNDDSKSPYRLINLDTARSVTLPANAPTDPAPPIVTASRQPISADAEHANGDVLSDLLQCTEARRPDAPGEALIIACPPMRRRLPHGRMAGRADRQMDAREAAERLANGWATGVSRIETGSLPAPR